LHAGSKRHYPHLSSKVKNSRVSSICFTRDSPRCVHPPLPIVIEKIDAIRMSSNETCTNCGSELTRAVVSSVETANGATQRAGMIQQPGFGLQDQLSFDLGRARAMREVPPKDLSGDETPI